MRRDTRKFTITAAGVSSETAAGEWLNVQRDSASVMLGELASQDDALAPVVVPHEQAHRSAQRVYTLGECSGTAAQALEVVAQISIEALYRVGEFFGLRDQVA